MAKEAPTVAITIDDSGGSSRTITNDVTSFDTDTPRAVQDVTGVDVASVERLSLLGDLSCTWNGVFNDASNMSHAVLKTAATTAAARTCTWVMSGQTLTAETILQGYSLSRGTDGSLTWSASGVLAATTSFGWS